MRRSAPLSVPGAAAGLPAPAPMLSVPIAPAFAAITTAPGDDAAVRNRERARAQIADVHPRTVAPGGARAGHRHRTLRACTIADVGGEGGVIDDRPTVRDRERARAKTADIEPAAWTVVPSGARAGHRHRTRRAGRQSDGAAAATVHRTAVLDGQACPCPSRRPRGFRCSSTWSPRRIRSPCPVEPGKLPTKPAAIGQRATGLDRHRPSITQIVRYLY